MANSTQSNLFYNCWEVVQSTSFFLYIFIGGRGIGKTYSTLKGLLESGANFMYIRRTQVEIDNCVTDVNNPFTTLNVDLNRNVEMSKNGDSYLIHEGEQVLGIGGALSTFGKFRGSDFSQIEYIVIEEFINTSSRETVKNEDDLFFNLLETVQRNREILGQKSIKVILLANSNKLDSQILTSLKLTEIIRQMKIGRIPEYSDPERSLYMALPTDLPITRKKQETALYKLAKGTKFYDMAIQNDFVQDTFDNVKKVPANQLIPLVSYEDVTFYLLKGEDLMYASYRKADCPRYNAGNFNKFKREFGLIMMYYIEGNHILYYDMDIKIKVKQIF